MAARAIGRRRARGAGGRGPAESRLETSSPLWPRSFRKKKASDRRVSQKTQAEFIEKILSNDDVEVGVIADQDAGQRLVGTASPATSSVTRKARKNIVIPPASYDADAVVAKLDDNSKLARLNDLEGLKNHLAKLSVAIDDYDNVESTKTDGKDHPKRSSTE